MWMPAIVVGDHGNGDVAELSLARQLGFLQVGHADDVHAQVAISMRLRFGGKLRALQAQVCPAALADDTNLLACGFDHPRKLPANWIGEGDVSNHSVAKESVHTMAGAIEKLVWNHEIQRLVLFFERTNGRNGDDALDTELFEAMNIGAEVQLARKNSVSTPVPR